VTSVKRIQNDFYMILGIIVGLSITITLFSPHVAYNAFPKLTQISLYVILCALFGFCLIVLTRTFKNIKNAPAKNKHQWLVAMITTGIFIRALMFTTQPILEDDWFRYLWDGAVISEDINPFLYAPCKSFDHNELHECVPKINNDDIEKLKKLSKDNDYFSYEVNYPDLTTIYPVGAQAGFRLANMIAPFTLNAWRTVLFFADSAALILLLLMLPLWGRSPLWASLYWLNPILIMEGYNSAHMDILLVAPLLGAIWAAKNKRPVITGCALGLAITIKIWPLLLIPLFIQPLLGEKTLAGKKISQWPAILIETIKSNWKALLKFLLPILVFASLTLAPLVHNVFQTDSGLGAYSREWAKNNFLFFVIRDTIGVLFQNPEQTTRIIIALLIAGLTLVFSYQNKDALKLPMLILVVTASLFFLAPAGYPWYTIWFIAFLPFSPNIGLLLLCSVLPLYYLRFPLFYLQSDWVFNQIIAPLEFGVPLLVILYSLWRRKKSLT